MWEEIFRRGWENFIDRTGGMMNFRFWLQPTVAFLLAVRAGLRDARAGQTPFLWNLLRHPTERKTLLRQSWLDVRNVFIVALVLDAIYQVIALRTIYPGELLFTATVLALVPYAVCRGLVTRLANLLRGGRPAPGPPGTESAESLSQSASSSPPAL